MKTEYAIVDIETTGGNASGSRITEIAILIHDGQQVVDRWETLVNPEKDIPPPIFALTGIDNDMVREAPIFDDIAQIVYEKLKDRIFVAHSVNFDYSFVRHQLEESGFKWTAKKLCTVRATRKVRPGLGSYSLGNLCRTLDIPMVNRHRAGGDADATAILFSRLLEWDTDGALAAMIKKTAQDQRLPPNLPPEDFERLPQKPGVYYFHDQYKKVIYVGKAVNLRKRVASHFSGHSIRAQRQNFLKHIHGISFEVCATELMALLLECCEIRQLWPEYNRALKRFEPRFGLYQYEARSGHTYLAVGKIAKFQSCIQSFSHLHEAVATLRGLAERFDIDHRLCKYACPIDGELAIGLKNSEMPDVDQHNAKVEDAIYFLLQQRESYAIVDKGRTSDERSCIWVEDGTFYGMGHIGSDVVITDIAEIKDHVSRYRSNHYIMQLLGSYARQNPQKVKRVTANQIVS